MTRKCNIPLLRNAAETLLVHKSIAPEFLPRIVPTLKSAGVEIRGCANTIALLPSESIVPATEKDWETEYSDLILSIKIVGNIDDAIGHINSYGSRHTESIVTEDSEAAVKFMNEVDAAGVFPERLNALR